MQIPWLTRPPTAEEVVAHAKAYPRARRSCGTWIRRVGSDMPFFVVLASDGEVLYWDGIKWDGTDSKDARWLSCTAEGIPVCFTAASPSLDRLLVDLADALETVPDTSEWEATRSAICNARDVLANLGTR